MDSAVTLLSLLLLLVGLYGIRRGGLPLLGIASRKASAEVLAAALALLLLGGALAAAPAGGGGRQTSDGRQATATQDAGAVHVQVTPPATGARGGLELHVIDVGQGLSVLVKLPDGKALLYDAGPHEAGPEVVAYLRSHGVHRLSAFVASHPDADHIGGAAAVLRAIPTEAVYTPRLLHTTRTYLDFLRAMADRGVRPVDARAGVSIPLGAQISARFVGPVRDHPSGDTNDASAVLRIRYGSVAVLLPGDAEARAEEEMMAAGEPLRATVLVVAHHGSRSSTSASFLRAVRPAYAVISVGAGNPYGHPAPETVGRLRAAGAAIFRTDLQGSVVAVTEGRSLRWNVRPLTPPSSGAASHPEWARALADLRATGDVDCGDFVTREAAQSFFLAHGGPAGDPYRLDGDHDGLACENLP
ncbi:MAG: MBL fold metallo-hydrolase [Bacillota bacterium]|nr:MBL fold metallo-hydrolase [Bacillota bacterium]